LQDKRNLIYNKEVINHNLEDQKYIFIIISVKKKINITKIHSETRHPIIPKMLWDERICHLCDTKKVEDEKHFLL